MPRKTAEPTPVAAAELDSQMTEGKYVTLALWDSVQETDPKYTKSFSRSGGFKGTAINHTYQTKRATAVFGPKGYGWGTHVLEEEYVKGAPLIHEKHGVIGNEIIHVLRIELWYHHNGQRCAFTSFGQTTFVGSNKHGFFTDEEAPKKSLTDAESKALAMLGFSADIHLGLFDDNKYVSDLKAKSEEADKAAKAEAYAALRAEIFDAVAAAATIDALKAATTKAPTLSEDDRAQLKTVYIARKAEIEAAK
jgi:hypothetical protein